MTPTEGPAVDLVKIALRADPYPVYARLRADSPVCTARLPGGGEAWLITRYGDVEAALKDPRLVKDANNVGEGADGAARRWLPGFVRPLTRNMLDLDEPDHGRLRSLVSQGFTRRRVAALGDRIQRLADELIDAMRDRDRVDLIRDYARPIPTTVIAEMLGIPAADRGRFGRWSDTIVAADSSRWAMLRAVPSLWAFMRYLRKLVRERRDDPGDDLLSALVEAEEAGDRLDEDELLAMAFLLLVAGHETTVNLIGNGTLALLRHPGQAERLRREPELIDTAVEELLRYDGPLALATERYAREDVEIGGVVIPAGSLVHAVLGSANRDPEQFDDPDRLDLARDPNPHVAFGRGPHYCLGAPLARLEGRIALGTLLRRARGLKLAVDPATLPRRRGIVLRGLEKLPLSVDAWRPAS